mmetsp:Transcript_48599/g.72526  ORF Transcript_48599/g.72526 Transcript_48599/m.72526 type:complete len:106 (-) Transcript_48599:71-388(-)
MLQLQLRLSGRTIQTVATIKFGMHSQGQLKIEAIRDVMTTMATVLSTHFVLTSSFRRTIVGTGTSGTNHVLVVAQFTNLGMNETESRLTLGHVPVGDGMRGTRLV